MVLEDLGSTNGTYLNEEPLQRPAAPARGRPDPDRRLQVHVRAMTCCVIAEQWHGSDLGRQRQGNEDNYFVRAPLFVVADGMGGAQAGEVAREMAVEAFDDGLPDGDPSETLAEVDPQRQPPHPRALAHRRAGRGHGHHLHRGATSARATSRSPTSATPAPTCWRDGELIRLTRDHSLVGELVARGKLTEEQAEAHPQRSRDHPRARARGRGGGRRRDLRRPRRRRLPAVLGRPHLDDPRGRRGAGPRAPDGLEQAGRELIAAANAAGGRDNITVVLFRLEEVERAGAAGEAAEDTEPGETGEFDTFAGEAVTEPRQGVTRRNAPTAHTRHRDELQAHDVADAVRAADDQEAAYRASGTVALSAVKPRAEPLADAPRRTAPLR